MSREPDEKWKVGITPPDVEIYVLPVGTRYLVVSKHEGPDVASAIRTSRITDRLPDSVLLTVDGDASVALYVNHHKIAVDAGEGKL